MQQTYKNKEKCRLTNKKTVRDFANAVIAELDVLSLDQYKEIRLLEEALEMKLHTSIQEYIWDIWPNGAQVMDNIE